MLRAVVYLTLILGPLAFVVQVPAYLDCTSEAHASWKRFRSMLNAARNGLERFPPLDLDLASEAEELVRKWNHKRPHGLEDFGPGPADFYHACHYGEGSDYCLYGHVAALTYIAHHAADRRIQQTLAVQALRLLSWGHCLDFMESSSWGMTVLDLWDLVDGPDYPHLFTTVHSMEWAEVAPATPPALSIEKAPLDVQRRIWVFEVGLHKALSHEPVNMIRDVLPDYDVVYANYMNPYEGRAEAAIHPFPRSCSPNCEHQQDSTPYIFPVFGDMSISRAGFQQVMRPMIAKPEVSRASLFLCTTPIYYCSFFNGLNRTVLGYFGLPLLYMVPREAWSDWVVDFVRLASSPAAVFFANNAILAEQVAWQSAVELKVLRPVAVHLSHLRYSPGESREILVPEPRDACILHCLIKSFAPSSYPLKFLAKADTDRRFETFARFRGVVLYPHDLALMMFYEFYAMGLPMFLPSHLSKYIFKYSASVPLLDFVPEWVERCRPGQSPSVASAHSLLACGRRPEKSPLSLTSSRSLQHFSKVMDYFTMPGLVRFDSIASLLEMLPSANFQNMSYHMRENHRVRLAEARHIYTVVVMDVLKRALTVAVPT